MVIWLAMSSASRARRREAHGDDLAHEAQLAGREDRLGRVLESTQRWIGRDRLDADHVVRGEDDAAELLGHLDVAQAGVRDRTSDEGNLARARNADIGDVLSLTPQEPIVFLSRDGRPDSMSGDGHWHFRDLEAHV